MFCKHCGHQVPDIATFCPGCGKEVTRPAKKAEPGVNLTSADTPTSTPAPANPPQNAPVALAHAANAPKPVTAAKTGKKSGLKKALAIVCAISLVLGLGAGAWWYLSPEDSPAEIAPYVCLTEKFTDVVVKDTPSAIKAVCSVSNVVGVKNGNEELKEVSVQTVGSDTYYRLQQYHQGLPVFARQVILSANKDGSVNSLTSNFLTIQQDIDTTPTVTRQQIVNSLKNYTGRDVTLGNYSTEDLIIYPQENQQVVLAYCIPVDGSEYIVDAKTGEVLDCVAALAGISESAECTHPSGKFQGVKITNGYLFGDEQRGIYILDAKRQKITEAIPNSSQRNIVRNVAQPITSVDTNFNGGADDSFTGKKTKEQAKVAGVLMEKFKSLQTYFRSFNQQQNVTTFGIINVGDYDLGGGSFNANAITEHGYADQTVISVIVGTNYDLKDANDDLGHEFTHGVTKGNNIFIDSGSWTENGALNEAYSDIFGELFEYYMFDEKTRESRDGPNWAIVDRNLANPRSESSLYPSHYSQIAQAAKTTDEWYYTTTALTREEATRFTHYACTVVSHAAYLMSKGVDGTKNQVISLDDLGELWYRSIFLMLPDADFSECRNAVELAAKEMRQANKLKAEQQACVSKAFDAVGIVAAPYSCSTALKENFELSICHQDDTYVTAPVDVVVTDESTGKAVYHKIHHRTTRVIMPLEKGSYTITLTNKDNSEQTYTIKIYVDGSLSNAKDTLLCHTNFSDSPGENGSSTNKNNSTTTSTTTTQSKSDTNSALSSNVKRQLEKQLEAMYIAGHQGELNKVVNFSNCTFDDLLPYIYYAKSDLGLYKLYNGSPSWNYKSNTDPLRRYDGHSCLDEDLTYWIATHLFPEKAGSTKTDFFTGNNFYIHNGKIYFHGYPNAGLMGIHTYTTQKCQKQANGRYLVTVQYECKDDESLKLLEQSTLEVEAALETDPTYGDYWRMYKVKWGTEQTGKTTSTTSTTKRTSTSSTTGSANKPLTPEVAVDIYMSQKSVWQHDPDYDPMQGYGYCLLDLDFDGVLELITSGNDGSMRQSYNAFYKINPTTRKVELIKESDPKDGGLDYYSMSTQTKLLKNQSSGQLFYLIKNYGHVSADEGIISYAESYLKNGTLRETYLFSEYTHPTDYDNPEAGKTVKYDFGDKENLSQSAYIQKVAEFYEENTDMNLQWECIYGPDFDKSSSSAQKQTMLKAYRAFSYNGFSFSN
ncbi:MAG: zinc-ribbon domain-containing protein [Ruminococcaceae bacterium]|nr:zinc-ribbon domain-containing protein [Oscillospiraceae bacterium]